ncbi:hypothetical protein KY284_037329 [Solanum tuberosum]|nr:hypothetical protein KY284_037329 [Solanum tuberosum]
MLEHQRQKAKDTHFPSLCEASNTLQDVEELLGLLHRDPIHIQASGTVPGIGQLNIGRRRCPSLLTSNRRILMMRFVHMDGHCGKARD